MTPKEPFNTGERRAVAALVSLYSFRMLGLFMVLPLLGIYTAGMEGATPQTIGIALGAYGLTQAALQLPLGWLSDRIGRRPVVLAGLTVFIAGSLVAANADTINGIIAGRFLQGCGAIAAALTALAADHTRETQRVKAMAFIGGSVGLSFVVALVLGPILASIGGLSFVFLVTAVLGSSGFLVVAFLLPPVQQAPGRAKPGAWEADTIFSGGLLVLYGSVFTLHAFIMATFLVVPRLLVEDIGFSADHHWIIYLIAVALSLPPALLLISSGKGNEDPRWVMIIAVSALASGAVVALNGTSQWWVGGGLALFFVGVNTLEAFLPALVTRLAPGRHRGTASGVFSTSQFLGIFLGGTMGGVLLGTGGTLVVTLAVLLAACIWLVFIGTLRLAPSIPATLSR